MKQTNLYIHKGTDYSKVILLKNLDGTIFNPTGYTIDANMKISPLSTTSIPFTIEVVSAAEGSIRLTMGNATSALLDVHRYTYTLNVISGLGVITKLQEGTVNVQFTVV